jgi:putative heme-binding domain-containing protein
LGELFTDALAQSAAKLRQKLADISLKDEIRITTAKDMIDMSDTRENVEAVLKQVTGLTPPELGASLVRVLEGSRNPKAGKTVVAHWAGFTPSLRAAAVAVILRRVEWANSFLDAISSGQIKKTDLTVDQWSQFLNNPNGDLAKKAKGISGASGAISADCVEIVKKLLPLAKEQGDPVRGKEVFRVNCLVCHTFAGEGGKVGPELTGIGARDHGEILIDILDPNRSVEANYRSWNVFTKAGESYSARLETETQTTVEILDAAGQKHVLQRKDVEKMNATQLSIMPNGFESLPPEDLKALLAYLTQSHGPAN